MEKRTSASTAGSATTSSRRRGETCPDAVRPCVVGVGPARCGAANKGAGHGGLPVRFPGRRLPAALPRADAEAHAGVGHLDRRAVQARAVQGRRSARAGRQAGEGQEEDRGGRPVRGGEGPGRRVPPGHGGQPRRRRGARARVSHPGGRRSGRGPPDPQDVSPAALPGLVDHLFRHEAGRLAAALVRVLGPANLDLAEDVVQETLCHALEVWKMGRVPDNPAAWLRASARNRALDLLRRQRIRIRLAPEVAQLHGELAPAVDAVFTEDALRVEQLRMMFACCDARLQPAVQVALVLKLLCGFGVDEVAQAVRAELCAEAIRLVRLLAEDPATAQPPTFALLALMCLHAARLPGRLDARGALVPLEEQDRSAWDRALAAEGARWLSRAVSEPPTALLLEAAIAAEHCFAPTFAATDWRAIVTLYDALYAQHPTPVVALNRAIALAQVDGPERGLEELQALPGRDRLARYPFYFAALGELHLRAGHAREAAEEFRRALRLARSPAERQHFQRKLASATERTRMRRPGAVRTLRR